MEDSDPPRDVLCHQSQVKWKVTGHVLTRCTFDFDSETWHHLWVFVVEGLRVRHAVSAD